MAMPIENLWKILLYVIYKNGKQYNNDKKLKNIIKYEWNKTKKIIKLQKVYGIKNIFFKIKIVI